MFAKSSVLSSKVSQRSVAVRAGNWLPGQPKPSYLPDSMIGSYGFDPLSFGKDPASLERFQEAEIIHGRWAMLGAAGALAPELLGLGDWYSAPTWAVTGGKATYFGSEIPFDITQITLIEVIAMAAAEGARAEASKDKKIYPGFDPLNQSSEDKKLKEVKNGRLAMVAFVGFIAQHAATGKGPIAALSDHLASPFTVNFATNGVSVPGLV